MNASPFGGVTSRAAIATIAAIAVGLVIGNTMPVVIGSIVIGSNASAGAAGLIVTAEFTASALAALALSPFVARLSLPTLAVAGSMAAAMAQAACGLLLPLEEGEAAVFYGLRIAAGLGTGTLLAAANAALARLDDSARAYAIAAFVSALVSAGIFSGLPALAGGNSAAGYFTLAAVLALPGVLYLALPRAGPAMQSAQMQGLAWLLAPGSLLVLCGGALMALALGAFWPFVEVVGLAQGLSREAIGLGVSVNMGAGLIGSGLAAAIGARCGLKGSWALCAGLLALVPLAVTHAHSGPAFAASQALYGAAYFTAITYLFAIGAARDPAGRLAAALGGAFLIGTGLGPALGGAIVDRMGTEVLGLGVAAGLASAAALVALAAPDAKLTRAVIAPVPAEGLEPPTP